MARPIRPPSASISRTRCPFAVPPTAGLHGIWATVSFDNVQSPTLHPSLAAAYAASTPACPAPMTMMSNRILVTSFPNYSWAFGCRAQQSLVRVAVVRKLHQLMVAGKLLADAEPLEDVTQHV